jgi:hypothetical protein
LLLACLTVVLLVLPSCRVWGPKVQPWSRWQAGLAQHQPLAFSLLFSSVASLLGSAGQANYAAANSALDAAAAADNARGISTTSVRWGAWAGAFLDCLILTKVAQAVAATVSGCIHTASNSMGGICPAC